MKDGLQGIENLTGEDSRSTYCLELVNALSEVYFINDIRKPQGVSALHVGQLENFQVDVNQAQELLLSLSLPNLYVEQHATINNVMNDLRLNLREDTSDPEAFSRIIQKDYEELSFTLKEIEIRSTDLLSRPEQLVLYADALN